ncbi:hypothetical protein [Endozoicomonas lisbonensis]|uniref:4Fe-4S ferredoxin-type domain-containing protein n=1 Tax=Endozoicomonas lisbonensis TaxID=3120522 RepID=A0ABV2SRQ9_9GAMM
MDNHQAICPNAGRVKKYCPFVVIKHVQAPLEPDIKLVLERCQICGEMRSSYQKVREN